MVIRMATDCTGTGIAEMGVAMLAMKNNFEVECVFMSGAAKPCQQWLESLEFGGTSFIGMTTRTYDRKSKPPRGVDINGVGWRSAPMF